MNPETRSRSLFGTVICGIALVLGLIILLSAYHHERHQYLEQYLETEATITGKGYGSFPCHFSSEEICYHPYYNVTYFVADLGQNLESTVVESCGRSFNCAQDYLNWYHIGDKVEGYYDNENPTEFWFGSVDYSMSAGYTTGTVLFLLFICCACAVCLGANRRPERMSVDHYHYVAV